MNFSEKLQVIRKSKGFTQESLAEKLNVSRQAIAKWEAGQAYPDIINLINISELFSVTVDYLVKKQDCSISPVKPVENDTEELLCFRLEAARSTYAAKANEIASTRMNSHDFRFEKDGYVYIDSYVGGEKFAGEEAIWKNGAAVYAMNYTGRVLGDKFSGDFLKEALKRADRSMPYRGPEYYQAGEYTYRANVSGDINWFQGYEEICCGTSKVYECYFHGCTTK